jgi:hypothetical protein
MANIQSQFGFKHVGYVSGGAPDMQLQNFTIASSYATQIGFGDPVTFTTSPAGTIIQATNSLATTQPIVGIFQGCYYIPTAGVPLPTWSPFWPGSGVAQNATAYVISAPNALFLAASLLTAIGTNNIGYNVNFTSGAPVTTGGGYSIATLDQSTLTTGLGTTSSFLPFKVYSMFQGIGNGSDPTTNYNWVVVSFNFQLNRTITHG